MKLDTSAGDCGS